MALALARTLGGGCRIPATHVDLLVRLEVILAERRRDVNDPGAAVERHEVRRDDGPKELRGPSVLAVVEIERRRVPLSDEVLPLHLPNDSRRGLQLLRDVVDQ